MGTIDNRQLRKLTDALERNGVQYLYIGKSAAIIHGFADTTQDADIYVNHTKENKEKLVVALKEIEFRLSTEQEIEIKGGKDFIQLHNGPFDLDLIYAPDGIEKFEDAWNRGCAIAGHKVCSIADIIASKRAANRPKDRESLARLEEFEIYMEERGEDRERLQPLNPTWRDRIRQDMATETSPREVDDKPDTKSEIQTRQAAPKTQPALGECPPNPETSPSRAAGFSASQERHRDRNNHER